MWKWHLQNVSYYDVDVAGIFMISGLGNGISFLIYTKPLPKANAGILSIFPSRISEKSLESKYKIYFTLMVSQYSVKFH